ncbi:MAG: NAD(P)-dependent oxidoreductase [Candidatus Latescibacteria bacterium]|nr:NAD(P)-dependent oxidoreductase [Candidatus Latescibacterota bacterium]MBT4140590.1 NAD(P)-dependent oxidoreductase [Candidatus Latescibacterota bacterium]
MEKIGFVGLGIMGKPMCHNLLKAGFEVVFHARRQEVVDEMTAAGATPASSSKAVAEATDIIVTIVTADAEVREVILGEGGVLEGASQGKLVVDMSTISPMTIREVAEQAQKKGVSVVDAPVSGGDTGAIAGTLTIIAGGEKRDVERCAGIFQAMGNEENIFHVGAVGVGQTVKITNQLLGGITMAAISEALTLGKKAGADPEVMRQVISVSTGSSRLFEARVADFLLTGDFTPGFMLDLMKKDIGIGVEMGRAMDVPVPIGAAAYQMYAAASSLGAGEEDFSAVSRAIEKLSGISLST